MSAKHQKMDPDLLSIIVPFPHVCDWAEKGLDLLRKLHLPIYAGLPAGSTETLSGDASPVFLEQSVAAGSWRFADCSAIRTRWCLLLEEDEVLERKALRQLQEMLRGLDLAPLMVSVGRLLPDEDIRQFDWVTTRQVFSSPTASMRAYHALELRLIPTAQLDGVTIVSSRTEEGASSFRLQMAASDGQDGRGKFVPLTISRQGLGPSENPWKPPEDRDIYVHGHGRFFDDTRFSTGFEWPRTVYVLILKHHVPAVIEALKLGVASRAIVMRTLYNLIQLGEYEQGAQLLPLTPEHWEWENPVLIQIKVMVYFLAGNIDAGRKVLERCHARNPDDPVILENIGKFFLLLNEREKAQEYFQESLKRIPEPGKRAYIEMFLQVLEENGGRWPTLAVCLICRDEERWLPRALKSVEGLADEIIVVDTGSVDRSREIAREAGARVFDYPWGDDFSEIRNFAMAKATSDYVLMLDADEFFGSLKLVEFHVLKRLLPLKRPRAFSVAIGYLRVETDWLSILAGGDNLVTETRAVRIFPNDRRLMYRGRFEESLVDSLRELDIPVSDLPLNQIWIQHHTDDRRCRLVRKMSACAKETEPSLGQIAAAIRDLSYLGDKEGTMQWFKRLVDMRAEKAGPFIHTMAIRLAGLLEVESQEKAQGILESLRKSSPEAKELTLALSSQFIRSGRFSELADLVFIDVGQPGESAVSGKDFDYWVHGGVALAERGDIGRAAWMIDQVLSLHPDHLLGQAARFYLLSRVGDLGAAASALEDILDITSGRSPTEVMTPTAFLNIVEELSDTLGSWGHAVERSLLLHGALALKGQLEASHEHV